MTLAAAERSPSAGRRCLPASSPSWRLLIPSSKAQAMKIQVVKSPGGITAWLVEEHSVPLIALRFAFEGGNAQDPEGKEGLANFLAGMLDEGRRRPHRQAVPGAHGRDRHAHELRRLRAMPSTAASRR